MWGLSYPPGVNVQQPGGHTAGMLVQIGEDGQPPGTDSNGRWLHWPPRPGSLDFGELGLGLGLI